MGVQGGEVSTGPGGQPAAEGRVSERLGEMPQSQTVGTQLVLQVWPVDARLDPGRAAGPIELQHRVEVLHVDGDRGSLESGLDASDHGTSTAVGDHGDAGAGAPVQQVDDVMLGAGPRDQIGDVFDLAVQVAHHVAEGLTPGMGDAVDRLVRAQRRQARRRDNPWRCECERGHVRRWVVGEVVVGEQRRGPVDECLGLGVRRLLCGVAPAPP